ncbi:MAG: hypothetical protein RLZZ584_372, partial [Pseudomonadota bacterium]
AVARARKQGYAITTETYAPGLNAISTAIMVPGRGAVGVLAISGPAVRLTEAKMLQWSGELLAAAADLGSVSVASPLLQRAWVPAAGAAAPGGSAPAAAPVQVPKSAPGTPLKIAPKTTPRAATARHKPTPP